MAKVTRNPDAPPPPREFLKLTKEWPLSGSVTVRIVPPLSERQKKLMGVLPPKLEEVWWNWIYLYPWKRAAWAACARGMGFGGYALYLKEYLRQGKTPFTQPISPCSQKALNPKMSEWDDGGTTWEEPITVWDDTGFNYSPWAPQPDSIAAPSLVELAAYSAGITPYQGRIAYKRIKDIIADKVKHFGGMDIPGFGTFYLTIKGAAWRKNPRNGLPVYVPAKQWAKFTMHPSLMDILDPSRPQKVKYRKMRRQWKYIVTRADGLGLDLDEANFIVWWHDFIQITIAALQTNERVEWPGLIVFRVKEKTRKTYFVPPDNKPVGPKRSIQISARILSWLRKKTV